MNKHDKKLIVTVGSLTASGAVMAYVVAQWTVALSTEPLQLLILQFVLQMVPHLAAYYLTYMLLRKIRYSSLLGISIVARFVALISFFAFAMSGHVMAANIVFGILAGAAGGMYWCGYNVALNRVERKSFRRYLSTEGSLAELLSIGAPLIMALCILAFGDVYSLPAGVYITLFAISSVLIVVAFVAIVSAKGDKEGGTLNLKGKFFSKTDKPWNHLLLFSIFYGIVSGVGGSLGGVILILFTIYAGASQVTYLVILSVCMLFAAVTIFVYRRIRIQNKFLYYFFVVLEAAVFLSIGFVYGNYLTVLACAIILLLRNVAVKMRLPLEVSCHVGLLTNYLQSEGNVAGRYFVREAFIVVGRLIGAGVTLVLALAVPGNYYFLAAVVFGFVAANILSLTFYTKVMRDIDRINKDKQEAATAERIEAEESAVCET